MRFEKIEITEFGGLRNKTVTFAPGFNLITGRNESGKSTVCAFIKYVLYGFDKDREKNEKAKRTGFTSGISAGSLTLVADDGKKYRLERRDGPGSQTSKVSVYYEDGSKFDGWKESARTPGEYFLGIPDSVYSRSLYVSQEYGAAQDDKSAEAIGNLQSSGNESVNVKKAVDVLDKYRKSLKVERTGTGAICELEKEIAQAERGLRDADMLKEQLAETETALKSKTAETEKLERNVAALKAAEEASRLMLASKLLHEKEEKERRLFENGARKSEIIKKYTRNGFLPGAGYTEELARRETECGEAQKSFAEQRSRREESNARIESSKPQGYDLYKKAGGKNAVVAGYKKVEGHPGRIRLLRTATFLVALTAIASLLLGRNGIVSENRYVVPFLVISVLAFVAVNVYAVVHNKRATEYLRSVGIPEGIDIREFCRECEDHERREAFEKDVSDRNVIEADKKLAFCRKALDDALGKWGMISVRDAREAYETYACELNAAEAEKNELEKELNLCVGRLGAFSGEELSKAAKSDNNDPALRKVLSGTAQSDINISTEDSVAVGEGISSSEARIASSEAHLAPVKARLAQAEARLATLDREVRELELTRASIAGTAAPDPEELTVRRAEAEKKRIELEFRYEAVKRAKEALENAVSGVRRTLSPYLGQVAGSYFERLTGGKYSALLFDDRAKLSYRISGDGETHDSVYLSTGSADLAWYCLRLALHRKLSEERSLPLILDECFVYFDDVRLSSVLDLLCGKAGEGTQIILFSASEREKTLLAGNGGVEVVTL